MWLIIQNEWRFVGRTRVLSVISAVFSLVLLLSVMMGIMENREQRDRYETAKKHLREQWENQDEMSPHTAAHYGTYIFKPTNLLTSIDEGVNSVTGNVLRIEGHAQNEIVHSEASQMQVISKFGKLKCSMLLKYILPLILIFLAFNAINREKQTARLKLLVLQGQEPSKLIFAKMLSVWLYGIVLLIVTIVVYTLINLSSINGDIMLRTALLFLSYALYYFILCALTIYLSIRWKNTNIALTTMLGVWILWTVFLPHILMSSVEKWYELPSREEFKTGMDDDRAQGIDGHNPFDERRKELEEKVLAEYGVDSLSQLPINFDGILMQSDEDYGNQVWDKHFGELNNIFSRQKKSYQMGGLLSPFISLQNASMGFAASDNVHHQEFLVQTENYRRTFIKALNDKHAFGGSTTGDWGWTASRDFFNSMNNFQFQATKISDVFPSYLLDLVFLFLWTILASVMVFFGTKKMSVL